MELTRRQWCGMALASAAFPSLPLFAQPPVKLGVSTFSFRDRSRNDAIAAIRELGVDGCELFTTHVYFDANEKPDTWLRITPAQLAEQRTWRLTTTQTYIEDVRAQFDRAGLELYLYYSGLMEPVPDDEVEKEFLFAKWLGVKTISFMCPPQSVARFAAAAEKHDLVVALHNTSSLFKRIGNMPSDPKEMLAQLDVSPRIQLNLDIGHFYAAGHDPVPFLKKHHARIRNIQLKDRRRPEGPNLPCGSGGTPIADVVRTVRQNRWPITMTVEYEHAAKNRVEEVNRCLIQAKAAMAT